MKKYLYITAFALPLAAAPAFAQDTTTPPADQVPAQQMDSQTPGAGTDGTAPDAGMGTDAPATDGMGTDPTGDAPADGMAEDAPMDPVPSEGMDAAPADGEATAPAAGASDAVVSQQDNAEMLGDWLMSTSVTSPEGETIGSIKDFIISEDGQITAVVLGVGGFLGMGEKDIAVDYEELDIQYDGDAIQLAMTREEAENAPEYQYRDKQTPPPATGDATGPTGNDMSGGATGMPGNDAGMADPAPAE